MDTFSSLFTCYSLRAGLVNNYAEHSDKFTEEELRSTGKWQSDAMAAYLRTSGRRRDKAVTKIQGIFDEEVKKAFFSIKNLFSSLPCLSTLLQTPKNRLSLTVIYQLVSTPFFKSFNILINGGGPSPPFFCPTSKLLYLYI